MLHGDMSQCVCDDFGNIANACPIKNGEDKLNQLSELVNIVAGLY